MPSRSLRARTGSAQVLVLQALPLMAAIFLLFPRAQGPLWAMPRDTRAGLSGLSDSMTPGTIANLIKSDAIVFRVQYPAPQAQSLSPASAAAGSGPTKVTVTGVGFFITSQITFDGAPAATTFVDGTHVEATLSASQLSVADTISVRVVNPAPGGGTSSALSFSVTNGVPSISALNPSSVTAGSPDRSVTIFGSGFVSTSTVKSNGVLVASDGGSRRLSAPVRHDNTTFAGDGWTFKAAPGWVVREGARRGDYEVARQQP
jgi:hypothetical protein